jgi:hypothetical protein
MLAAANTASSPAAAPNTANGHDVAITVSPPAANAGNAHVVAASKASSPAAANVASAHAAANTANSSTAVACNPCSTSFCFGYDPRCLSFVWPHSLSGAFGPSWPPVHGVVFQPISRC